MEATSIEELGFLCVPHARPFDNPSISPTVSLPCSPTHSLTSKKARRRQKQFIYLHNIVNTTKAQGFYCSRLINRFPLFVSREGKAQNNRRFRQVDQADSTHRRRQQPSPKMGHPLRHLDELLSGGIRRQSLSLERKQILPFPLSLTTLARGNLPLCHFASSIHIFCEGH